MLVYKRKEQKETGTEGEAFRERQMINKTLAWDENIKQKQDLQSFFAH